MNANQPPTKVGLPAWAKLWLFAWIGSTVSCAIGGFIACEYDKSSSNADWIGGPEGLVFGAIAGAILCGVVYPFVAAASWYLRGGGSRWITLGGPVVAGALVGREENVWLILIPCLAIGTLIGVYIFLPPESTNQHCADFETLESPV